MGINFDKLVRLQVQRDARNNIISTISYCGGQGLGLQDSFDMDDITMAFACNVSKKIIEEDCEGLVLIDASTMKEVDVKSVDPAKTTCFISGSDPGYIEKAITSFKKATSQLDVMVPFYVGSAGYDDVSINKEELFKNIGKEISSIEEYRQDLDKRLANMIGIETISVSKK